MEKVYNSFHDFYPFYIQEHSKALTKIFHFVGTGFFIGVLGLSILDQNLTLLIWGPIGAYALAWFSHFFIEKNRPATFKYPLYSLVGDFRMFFELLTLRRKFF